MAAPKVTQESLYVLDYALLKVPQEQLGKSLRASQKLFEREMQTLTTAVSDLSKAAAASGASSDDLANQISSIVHRLTLLKRKYSELASEESDQLSRFGARLSHLEQVQHVNSTQDEVLREWNHVRLNRLMVDLLLRDGHYESAAAMARETNCEALCDIDLFLSWRKVEESLRAGSCTEGLQWCRENGSRLRKIQSSFEFNLRVQEFVELVREQRLPAAISYASSHFEPWLETNAQQVRRAMALLAFLPGTSCQRYSDLYDPSRWAQLANQFREANFALFSLTPEPLLTLTMQAGLSALKTPACVHAPGKPSANPDCPACNPIFEKIAAPLPRALHVNSTLVCRIDGSVMNADNPPTMLPNNQIYSLGALERMAAKHDGVITCPTTGFTCTLADTRKVFPM